MRLHGRCYAAGETPRFFPPCVFLCQLSLSGGAGPRSQLLLQREQRHHGPGEPLASPAPRAASAAGTGWKRGPRGCPHPLVALLGGVLPESANLGAPVATVGHFDTAPDTADHVFRPSEVHVQPGTALELMALAQWAVRARAPTTRPVAHAVW